MALREQGNRGIVYVKIKNGGLVVNEGGVERVYGELDGVLESIDLREDAGNVERGIKPSLKLVVRVRDGDEVFLVEVSARTTGARMLAKGLRNIALGERFQIGAYAGSMETVTCVSVRNAAGEVMRSEWPKEMAERTPENAEVIDAQRNALVQKWMREHMAYKASPQPVAVDPFDE